MAPILAAANISITQWGHCSLDGNFFAMLNAESHKAARHAVDKFTELLPGEAEITISIDDSVVVVATGDGAVEKLAQSIFVGDRVTTPWDTGRD